jgi:spermidine synthase
MDQIHVLQSGLGAITIHKDAETGAVLYELEGCGQSSADSGGVSLASYIHAIFGLLTQAKARDILIIGGAGGTLATMLARTGRRPVLVDCDPQAFILARQYFQLAESVTCHLADGERFLRADTGLYGAIVLDAFVGNEIPAHLQTPEFFDLARGRLAPGGTVFANVHIKHDFDDYADRLAKTMKSAWPDARVLDAMGLCPRNAIVMAGGVAGLRPPKLIMAPNTNAGGVKTALERLQFRAWKTSRWGR